MMLRRQFIVLVVPCCCASFSLMADPGAGRPSPGSATKEEDAQQLRTLWHDKDDELLEELK
jgi:hypothetical protein